MARYSVKDVSHLTWFMKLKLDQTMKLKIIFQQNKLYRKPSVDLSTEKNCHQEEMKTVR